MECVFTLQRGEFPPLSTIGEVYVHNLVSSPRLFWRSVCGSEHRVRQARMGFLEQGVLYVLNPPISQLSQRIRKGVLWGQSCPDSRRIKMPFECRSTQQVLDDEVCEAHTRVVALLNQTSAGRCLYFGAQRNRLYALKQELEAVIGGAPWNRFWWPEHYLCSLL